MKQTKVLFAIAVTTLLIFSCQAQPIPTTTNNPTDLPTATVPTSTAIVEPTSTQKPTQTATPIPGWITDFAEPVLKAIQNQPPKFQDDFSDRNSNWLIGKQFTNDGETGYLDGEYFTIANPNSCHGGGNSRIGEYQDFIAEFDARFVSSTNDGWQFQFHNNQNGLYTISIAENFSDIWIQKCVLGSSPVCENIAKSRDSQIKNGAEWNHMILIVRGARIGVYANGAPVLYTEDRLFSEKFEEGTFSFSICSHTGNVPVEIRWDNLKLWDISKLP